MKIFFAALVLLAPCLAAADTVCPDLNALQRFAGYLSCKGSLQLIGSACIAIGGLYMFSGLIRQFLFNRHLIELLAWCLAIGGMASCLFMPRELAMWSVLAGAMLLPGAMAFSIATREIQTTFERTTIALTLTWGILAVYTQFSQVGFLAVMGLVALLGLRISVWPMGYVFGFKDGRILPPTVAGAVITLGYALAVVGGAGGGIDVFRSGALWLGSFTWFLGVLILSNRWYCEKYTGSYRLLQAGAILSFALAISLGLLWQLRELTTMSSALLLFYLAAKLIEVPWNSHVAVGVKLAGAGGLVFGAWYWLHNHEELATRFLAV